MKLNRLILASLIGISLSTPAWACDPGKGGGLFSFFHHTDSDHDKDSSHHGHDGDKSNHGGCSGGDHSGTGSSGSGSGSSGSGGSTSPAK